MDLADVRTLLIAGCARVCALLSGNAESSWTPSRPCPAAGQHRSGVSQIRRITCSRSFDLPSRLRSILSEVMAEDAVACPHCGCPTQAGGFELVFAGFPRDFDDVEHVITAATRFAVCPQCLRLNERVERVYVVAFPGARKVLLRAPSEATEDDVEGLCAEVLGRVEDDWTVDVHRDVGEFRQAVGFAALGSVRLNTLAEITGDAHVGEGLPLLAPQSQRDRDYHAALALIGRPGVLTFNYLPDGTSHEDARAVLDEAHRFQLAIGFFEAFAKTRLADFDPVTAIQKHFVPECFEDEQLVQLIALIIKDGEKEGDVAVLDAALGAAAGRRSPRRSQLAEELVDRSRAGVELHDDPSMWRALVDAEDVLRALLREPVKGEAALTEMTRIAVALGHGEELLRRFRDRHWVGEIPDPGKLLATAFAVAKERGTDDEAFAETAAMMIGAAGLTDAHRILDALLESLGAERLVLAVPAIRTLAKRLTDAGEPQRALHLLGRFDSVMHSERVPGAARATLLNECGNAHRALLNAEEALRCYEQAFSHIEPGANECVIRLNMARALRDAGHLPRAIAAFKRALGALEGRDRFDVLFGLALAYQRNGQWAEAQPVLDEALELVRADPADDQIVRFVHARLANARALGREEAWPLIEAIRKSPFVSARQQLLTLGAASLAAVSHVSETSLNETTLELARGLDLPTLAESDPEFAIIWADAARLAGDVPLAWETLEIALARLREPVLGMRAASVGAGMAVDAEDWAEVTRFVDKVSEFMTGFVATASVEATTVTVSDTLSDFRDIAARIAAAPRSAEHDRLLSRVADLGSSLQLSVQIASEHLPLGGDLHAPPGVRLQLLQWLNAGDVQLPLLAIIDERGPRVHRGGPLPTDVARGLGARIAGRMNRSLALETKDLLEGVTAYRTFRDHLASALAELPLDPGQPLTVTMSAPLLGIPLHTALPNYDIAFTPSLTVAVALAHRAATAKREQDAVAEVCCWCHGDDERLIADLAAGAEALRQICRRRESPYTAVVGTEATKSKVSELVKQSPWLKLSCHGITEPTQARFALVLSDGQQAPPAVSEVFDRQEFAGRYLFDWGDIADTGSGCRAVLSSACTSGSAGATVGGEQIGLARAYLRSGVLAFVAPLWPVAAGPAQLMINELIDRCMGEPDVALATQLHRTRVSLADAIPPRVRDAFVLHGHPGPVNPR
jgi:tetratricopeptide (TPR) repeat protein